jgi:uncharacterized protein (TIGR02300 family)
VAKAEWGIKRLCPNCGTRYYDMRKDPPVCPACATVFDPEALLRSRRARPIPVEEVKRPAAARVEEGEEVETEEAEAPEEEADVLAEGAEDDLPVEGIEGDEEAAEDEEDVLIEDTSELGDEDDVGEVVEIEEGEEER